MVKIWQKLIETVNNRTVMTQEAIDKLKNNTMFHFSLGSKKLFHSNFLPTHQFPFDAKDIKPSNNNCIPRIHYRR